MKINRKLSVEKWEKFDGEVEFLIRRFPYSITGNAMQAGMILFEQFDYCVTGWKGILDEDDKPLVYNDENKLYLFNYYQDVREFVYIKINLLSKKEAKELKNLRK